MSDSMSNIELKLEKLDAKDGVVTILQGDFKHPEKIPNWEVSGSIMDPLDYVKKYMQQGGKFPRPTLTFDSAAKKVVFESDPQGLEGKVKITGKMVVPAELDRLGIGTGKGFNKAELLAAFKAASNLFVIQEELEALVDGLKKFHAKVELLIVNENDQKGNKTDTRQQTLSLFEQINTTFKLGSPPFAGLPPKTFNVDILVDYKGGDVIFQCDSWDLYRAQNEAYNECVEQYRKECKEFYMINI